LIDIATEYGVISKGGSWYTYGSERVQGREGLKKMFNEKPEALTQLETEIRKILNESKSFSPSKNPNKADNTVTEEE
jgi:hypothetical protein